MGNPVSQTTTSAAVQSAQNSQNIANNCQLLCFSTSLPTNLNSGSTRKSQTHCIGYPGFSQVTPNLPVPTSLNQKVAESSLHFFCFVLLQIFPSSLTAFKYLLLQVTMADSLLQQAWNKQKGHIWGPLVYFCSSIDLLHICFPFFSSQITPPCLMCVINIHLQSIHLNVTHANENHNNCYQDDS